MKTTYSTGDHVNVTRMAGDQFAHDFTGSVVAVDTTNNLIVVEDEDGDCWSCEPDQLSYCSDNYMH